MPLRRLITGPFARAGLSAGMLAFLVQILAWSLTMPAMALADERMLPGAAIAAGWFLSTLQARAPPVRA